MTTNQTAIIHNLVTHEEARRRIEWSITSTVIDARAAGASWAQVGNALGVTKQAAAQKYSKAVAGAEAHRAAPAPAPQLDGQTTIEVDAEEAPAPEPTSAGQDFYACPANGCEWTITTPVEDWKQRERAIDHHELEHEVGTRIDAVVSGGLERGTAHPTCDELGNVTRACGNGVTIRTSVYNGSHAVKSCNYCGVGGHYKKDVGYWMYEGCDTTKRDYNDYKAGKR